MIISYVIYGAGGHASVVADLINLLRGKVETFFDDQPKEVPGGLSRSYVGNEYLDSKLIVAIGNNLIREEIASKVSHQFGTLIHPSAYVAKDVELGEGTVVLANAVVQSKAKIGNHVIINAGVCIDHNAIINDFVLVYPNVYIGGGAVLEKGALVNAGAVIQRNAVVRAGKEVPPLSVIQ